MAPSAVSFTAFAQPVRFSVRNARVAYEPSVYGGDGSETRVNMTLSCGDGTIAGIRALEGSDDHSLISCVKDAGVRAKLDKTTVRIFDADGKAADAPTAWRGRTINAILVATGTWKTRSGSGICLSCSDLQLLPEEPETCPF
jgi:hypothetical protein